MNDRQSRFKAACSNSNTRRGVVIQRIAAGLVILVALAGLIVAFLASRGILLSVGHISFDFYFFDFYFVPFGRTLTTVLFIIFLGIGLYWLWRVQRSERSS
jgi:uncharacterized BrkB/YihY/UPF0761 family membrane protein